MSRTEHLRSANGFTCYGWANELVGSLLASRQNVADGAHGTAGGALPARTRRGSLAIRLPALTPASPCAKRDNPAQRLAGGVAMIVGMGAGLGEGLVQTFVDREMRVAAICRDASRWDDTIRRLRERGRDAHVYAADVTCESSMRTCIDEIARQCRRPRPCRVLRPVIHSRRGSGRTSVAAFEEAWRANCLGAFIAARELGARHGNARIRHHRLRRCHFRDDRPLRLPDIVGRQVRPACAGASRGQRVGTSRRTRRAYAYRRSYRGRRRKRGRPDCRCR